MKRLVIFVAGTKGGVGKSFAAIALAGAAADLKLSYIVYDTDNENRTVSELLKDHTEFLDETSEKYPLDAAINSLFDGSEVKVTIVDMKAGTSRSTQEWFSSVPWEMIAKTDVEIYVAGCITSDPDSVRTFVPWFEYFRHIVFPVNYLIIKNEKDGEHFYTCNSLLEPVMQKLKLNYSVFVFPAIEQEYINILNNSSLTLRGHMLGEDKKVLSTVMQKSRLRNHYLTITDPLVLFFASRMDKSEFDDSGTKVFRAAQRRTALRSARQNHPEAAAPAKEE